MNGTTGFDPSLPLERGRTIPSAWYFDPAIFERERDLVFAASWQMVGLAGQVAEPGQFLTAEIAGEPILVVRDTEGVLRAFFNVCRHRAAPILTEPCGQVTKLRCRYHGWTYDLTGKLRGTPEFDGVQDFCKEDNGLPEMAVGIRFGIVWVHPASNPEPLDDFLAPLPNWLQGREIESMHCVKQVSYDLACNWKVYVDNYLDGGYHIHTVHPALSGVIDYSQYRTTIHDHTSLQSSPLSAGSGDDEVARTRKGDLAAYWWVYPNFMLNLYDGVMDLNLVQPLGPDRCRVVFWFFFRDTEGEAAKEFMTQSMNVGNQVQVEDVGICEEVQRGLKSRSYTTGRFSVKREIAGYYFHQLLGKAMGS